MPPGKQLRLELIAPALVHWSFDSWKTAQDTSTRDVGLGVHLVDLPADQLASGGEIVFTFYWKQDNRWEGVDFRVMVE
jgi:glucoamylase